MFITDLSQRTRLNTHSDAVGGAWESFLNDFDWHYFVSLTHRDERSPTQIETAVRSSFLRRLARIAQGPLGWFFAVESHRASRAHAHVLIQTPSPLILSQVARAWKFGFADVRSYDRSRGAGAYITKDVQREATIYDLSPRIARWTGTPHAS